MSGAHNYKRYVSKNLFILAFLFVLVIASIGLGAASASKPYLAPLSPAFVTYMYRLQAGAPLVQVTPGGYYLRIYPLAGRSLTFGSVTKPASPRAPRSAGDL